MPSRRAVVATALVMLIAAPALAGCVSNGEPESQRPPRPESLTAVSMSPAGLPPSRPSEEVRLADGATFELRAGLVAHDVGNGRPFRAFAYNGMIPGPTLRIPTGAKVLVDFANDLPYETTVHWHGLRLDARFDGVPHVSQDAVPPGGAFRYEVRAPDEGVFWYHPHVREDMQQELGLLGLIVVESPRSEGEAWPREVPLVLDDILLERGLGVPAAMWNESANHVLMGRFGNYLTANGVSGWNATAAPGERVRLQMLNAANARPFNVVVRGATRAETVALDGGFLREPRPFGPTVLAPSERLTVDVVMPASGDVVVGHEVAGRFTALATVRTVGAPVADVGAPDGPHARARESLARVLAAPRGPADVTWTLDVESGMAEEGGMDHPGMDMGGGSGDVDPIEWESADGPEARDTLTSDVRWIIRDLATSRENHDINYSFERGDLVRIDIRSPASAAHPMQHPIHLHGQRFIVESFDGKPNPDAAWKDTVLVRGGETVTILVEMSNTGDWVFHCHVSEHLESGMEGRFRVA